MMRPHLANLLGTITSSVSAIAAWQEHVDWLFRVGASSVAMLAGLLTIISIIRNWRKKRAQEME